jgi:hypothetical protein
MKWIVFSYIIILVFQYWYIKNYLTDWQKRLPKNKEQDIDYNKQNSDDLINVFSETISQRVNLLKSIKYDEWLNYNNDNCILEYGEGKYEIHVFERVQNNLVDYLNISDSILKVSSDKESVGLLYSDLIKEKNYSFLFSMFSLNPNMVNQMYELTKATGTVGNADYYWLDDISHRAVKKKFIFLNYEKETSGNNCTTINDNTTCTPNKVQGVICISYVVSDVELDYSNKYYDFVEPSFLISVSIGIFISSVILYLSTNSEDIVKPLFLLFGSNAYLTYFMSTTEGVTSLPVEQEKVKDINDGILSISFLVAVNIFIIETLKKVKTKYSLHNESAFLFCLALILLLMALYKKSNYNKIDNVRAHRIEKQFMYNLSIFINLFILVNYLAYIGKETKIFKGILPF